MVEAVAPDKAPVKPRLGILIFRANLAREGAKVVDVGGCVGRHWQRYGMYRRGEGTMVVAVLAAARRCGVSFCTCMLRR